MHKRQTHEQTNLHQCVCVVESTSSTGDEYTDLCTPNPKLEYRKYAESDMNENKTKNKNDLPFGQPSGWRRAEGSICTFICYFVTRENPLVCFSCSQLFVWRHFSAKAVT